MNKPAIAGPIELPMILNKLLIPSEIPICSNELCTITILVLLTFVKEIPMDIITKYVDMYSSFNLINESKQNPSDIARVPINKGVVCPILVIIKPAKGPKIKSRSANGICTSDICTALLPKPTGYGLWINIGNVWKTVNMNIPTNSKMMFADKILLSRNKFELIIGNLVLLSYSKKAIKLPIKIIKKYKELIGTLIDSNGSSLEPKLLVLRNVMNKRKEIILTPNNIDPNISNFCDGSFCFILVVSICFFSVGINFMITIMRHIAIGIIEKNVSRQP